MAARVRDEVVRRERNSAIDGRRELRGGNFMELSWISLENPLFTEWIYNQVSEESCQALNLHDLDLFDSFLADLLILSRVAAEVGVHGKSRRRTGRMLH